MRLTRVFVEQKLVAGKGVGLPEQAGLHLTRVLRLDVGAPLTLFDGRAANTTARSSGTARTGGPRSARTIRSSASRRWTITLLQGVARGERMDLIVQKATELGVSRIVPVLAERSVVKIDAEQRARKQEHWQAVAVVRVRTVRAQSRARSRGRHFRWVRPSRALPADAPGACWRSTPPSPWLARCAVASRPSPCSSDPKAGSATTNSDFALANGFKAISAGTAHPAHRNRGTRGARASCRRWPETSHDIVARPVAGFAGGRGFRAGDPTGTRSPNATDSR